MENNKPENPNAFPNTNPEYFGAEGEHGMTLRDYAAIKAANGIIIAAYSSQLGEDKFTCNGGWLNPQQIAKDSYAIADAMLKERSNTP